MRSIHSSHSAVSSERGAALVFALLAIMVTSALGASYLVVSGSLARRSTAAIESDKAFYLAEAGLAEAFHAVRMGYTGQLASEMAPATFGSGYLWVDSKKLTGDQVELRSTALVGATRSSLAYVIEPEILSLGFFSDEDLVVESVVMLDGFDSSEGAYTGQVTGEQLVLDPDDPTLVLDSQNKLAFYQGLFYRYQNLSGETISYDRTLDVSAVPEFAENFDFSPFLTGRGDLQGPAYQAVVDHFASLPYEISGSAEGEVIPSQLGPTTGSGALVGSNGEVVFQGTGSEVFGNVVSGPMSETEVGEGVQLSGDWNSRAASIALPEVQVPDVALQAPVVHDDFLPMLVSSGTSGFSSIEVASNAQLVVRGPATVVIGSLTLQPGAELELDTRGGEVSLYITQGLDFAEGGLVTTPGEPDEFSIQVDAIPTVDRVPVQLRSSAQFYGTIYAPDTEVTVGKDFEVFGAITARKLTLEAGARLHYDHGGAQASAIPRLISWKVVEVPRAVNRRIDVVKLLSLEHDQLPPLEDAHSLAGVNLNVTYVTDGGVTETYSGAEEGFDWDRVAKVIDVHRETEKEVSDPGQDTGGGMETMMVRPDIRSLFDTVEVTGFFAQGGIFLSMISDKLPLTKDEWMEFDTLPSGMSQQNLEELRSRDIEAGGTGGL